MLSQRRWPNVNPTLDRCDTDNKIESLYHVQCICDVDAIVYRDKWPGASPAMCVTDLACCPTQQEIGAGTIIKRV